MGKIELVALLNLSSWCLVMVERLFHAVPWGYLWFVVVVFPDHTHLLFLTSFILNDYHLQNDTISMRLSSIYCNVSQIGILKL